ncbi:MAG: T9SS type A sorting domain-containing protein [Chryseolinea sp.]
MKKILALSLLLLTTSANASHIVGGEFRMHYLTGYQYKIDLILYFDKINGNPASMDNVIDAKIFRNSDNAFVRNVQLPLSITVNLGQTQPECAIDVLLTSQLTYTTTLTLQPEIFNDPAGYYIVWERCCRNYTITNVYSNDPGSSSLAAGQTFFLQFPPVVKNGSPFVNSSPQLFVPLMDYACIGRTFYTDFASVDADGDSLAYSIATPLSTHTFDALPQVLPKPYPEITWRPPFSSQNMMGGNLDLKISNSGLVTVKTALLGLFAFAVKCEEYRNGVKIGEVRREYQLLVRDCPANDAPSIAAKSVGNSYSELPLNVHFDNTIIDAERCIQVKVTDNDALTSPENISIKAIPIGFEGDVSGILPSTTKATLSQENLFAEFSICFDRCPLTDNGLFQIGIIAFDNACSVPLTDTIRINVLIDVIEGICQKKQSIDFQPISDRTFGDSPFEVNATASSGLPVNYTSADITIASVSTAMLTIHNPGRVTITAMQSGDSNYKPAAAVDRKFCINPQPPTLTLSADGSSIIINSSSPIGNRWYKDGVFQEGLIGNSIQVSGEATDYTARIMIDNCMSEPSNSIIITAIDEVARNEARISPNPTNNGIELHISANERIKTIEVYDIKGQRLLQHEVSGENHFVNMEGWESGIYLVKIKSESGVYVSKVFKN